MLCKQCFRSTLGFHQSWQQAKKKKPPLHCLITQLILCIKKKCLFIWTCIVRVRQYCVNANITSSKITAEAIKRVALLAHEQLLFLDWFIETVLHVTCYCFPIKLGNQTHLNDNGNIQCQGPQESSFITLTGRWSQIIDVINQNLILAVPLS